MSRRAGLYFSYFALFVACLYGAGCDGCSGTPSNFNAVHVTTATPIILRGGTASISATVQNDSTGDGVSWSLVGAGALTGATKTAVTYQAPASVAVETLVTVKATSVSFPSSSSTIQITIEPPLSITTTSPLSPANDGTAYSAQVSAVGGVPPFTWSIVSGSLTSQLALGASTTRSATISGTPLAQTTDSFTIQIKDSLGGVATRPLSIVIGPPLPLQIAVQSLPAGAVNQPYSAQLKVTGGVPPFNWSITSLASTFPPGLTLSSSGAITGTPTAAGSFTFNLLVTDSELPALQATGSATITINNLAAVAGNYAFEFNGFDSAGNAVVAAGSFTLDGNGNITAGVEDTDSLVAAPKNQTFTGTYTLDAGNQGLLAFSSLAGSPSYAFALDSSDTHGRLIEFDSTGIRGSGDLEERSLNTCSASTFNGNYAFGLMGHEAAITGIAIPGPVAIAGSFTATGQSGVGASGSIGPAEMDANTPQRVTVQDKILNGTFQATSQTTRCSMTLMSTLPTMTFSVYPVSATAAFMVETDTVGNSTPLLTTGTIQQQTGYPFSSASGSTFSSAKTSVAALTGSFYTGTKFVPDVAILSIAGTGASSFTLSATENLAGTVTTVGPQGSNFVLADIFGRVAATSGTPYAPVFYMISQNTAYMIAETTANGQPNPLFGIFQPQSAAPFTATTIAGVFVEGASAPQAPAAPDISGSVALASVDSTSGTLAGSQNQSATGGIVAGQTVAGTYSSVSSTAGTGLLTLTQPAALTGSFVIVSPSEFLMITTTPGDANPVAVLFEQ